MSGDRQKPSSVPQARPAPRVTKPHWILAIASLAIASFSYATQDYSQLCWFAIALLLLNAGFVIFTTTQVARSLNFGLFVIVAGCFWYFHLEGFAEATREVPFALPLLMRYGAGQFDPDVVQRAFFYVSLFQLVCLGYSVRIPVRKLRSWTARRLDRKGVWMPFLIAGLAALTLFPFIATAGFDSQLFLSRLTGTRAEIQEVFDAGGSSIRHTIWIGMFGAALLMVRAVLAPSKAALLGLGFALFVPLPIMTKGTRHQLLYVLVPIMVAPLVRARSGALTSRTPEHPASQAFGRPPESCCRPGGPRRQSRCEEYPESGLTPPSRRRTGS